MAYKLLLPLFLSLFICSQAKLTEDELKRFLETKYEKEASQNCYKANVAEFDYETDINNKTKEELTTTTVLEIADWVKNIWSKYFKDIEPNDYSDPSLKRQVRTAHLLGDAALDKEKLAQLTNTTNTMTGIYGTGKICPYKKQQCDVTKDGLGLEPDIENVMAKSTDYDELVYTWKSWRDATGVKIKKLYPTYVTLANEAAKANNFSDRGAYWRFAYEDDGFVQNMDDIWTQVEPLYNELHKYVGRKLKQRYGDKLNVSDGLIPAHVFGNMWAQSWGNIADLVVPFPNVSKMDVDSALVEQKYTVLDLFKTADEFYQSLGLLPMGMCYNESAGAMINKPTDGREVVCHASAWDFCDGETYRLKMCTEVNYEDFITIHHEMGHIQYYLQYKNQPYAFREGANPGFHEAIGDTMALSVATPNHLKKINLLKNYTETYEASINSLMHMALEKIAFLPFGLLIDKWRWDVFSGSVPENKWNSHWWDYRKKYQKVKAPIERSDETDFDPGAKFHVPGDSQYIAYFLAHILQFQFYKSLCIAAQEYDPVNKTVPLHNCDFYKSVAAGDKLRAGLQLGSSKHWSETLEILTGTKKVSAEPLLEYFEPLYKFLKTENEKAEKPRR
ncbi:angiotensin-converting enzyme-like isoform X2 [Anoplophora glabripennis]|uniref:angiotensin-converting enzyme-like isoform X2 n=1 Tax=Anoplophora glabripennis TaxID=217634 RepID=UPI0008739327|nr:angiotensin-converting enzyme-like isoform X2 [Anoplophora glabripennis]